MSQTSDIKFLNTVALSSADSKELIIKKAAHVVPTANQLSALQNEFIAFIHFGPNTFTRMEWGNGKEDPGIFGLKHLDTDQWCQAMKAAGMKMVIFTAKHHDGFVLWQSRYTTQGVMSTGFENGKGDILKDLSASCKKYGLKLGVYLSPADLFQIENSEGLYGNLSSYTARTIPREIPGRPFLNKTKFEFVVDDYNEYFLNQLFELLTEYGPISEVWFDGAHPKTKGGQRYNYAAWKTLIHKLAPKAVIFGREDVRWCGNEAGETRPAEWNVIPYSENPDTTSRFPDMTAEDIASRDRLYGAQFLHYQQAETNTSIREGWFYRDDKEQKVRSVDDVFDMYERSVGGNTTFLLNIPPNREGKFSAEDVSVLNEVGKRIRETYGNNLLRKSDLNNLLADDNLSTFLPLAEKSIVITTQAPITVNRFVIQEAVHQKGERVEKHAIDAWIGGEWKEIAAAANIGYKRILRFPQVTASRFRVRIEQSRLTPAIATIGAYFYKTRPPELQVFRNSEGKVVIQPIQSEFNWKPHGENASKNINKGMQIFYTTDGGYPTVKSKVYATPFDLSKGNVKAVAIINNEMGAVVSETLSLSKIGWKIINTNNKSAVQKTGLAIDGNKKTWWESGASDKYLAIDLGSKYRIEAFGYTPQTQYRRSMMARGDIEISDDGIHWRKGDDFEFGNLINDPSTRKHYFKKIISTRYIRIIATQIEGKDQSVAIAELDFFEN